MVDEKKGPPSEFTEEQVVETKSQLDGFTRGILLLSNEDYTQTVILEDFQYLDKKFEPRPGQLRILLSLLNQDMEKEQVAHRVLNRWLNEPITVEADDKGTKVKMPFLEYLLLRLKQEVGPVASAATLETLKKAAQDAAIAQQLKGGLYKIN